MKDKTKELIYKNLTKGTASTILDGIEVVIKGKSKVLGNAFYVPFVDIQDTIDEFRKIYNCEVKDIL